MNRVLSVVAGGGLGALCRYLLTIAMDQALPAVFPLGTFLINLVGSFALGLLYELSSRLVLPLSFRAFAGSGFLGAFTTFSTLAFEANTMIRGKQGALATTYVLASALLGVLACSAGMAAGRTVARAA